MPPWQFRIRFFLAEGCRILHDEYFIDIPLPPGKQQVVLRSLSRRSLKQSTELTVSSSGFSSET